MAGRRPDQARALRTRTKTGTAPQCTKCAIQPKGTASSSRLIQLPVNRRQMAAASVRGDTQPAPHALGYLIFFKNVFLGDSTAQQMCQPVLSPSPWLFPGYATISPVLFFFFGLGRHT